MPHISVWQGANTVAVSPDAHTLVYAGADAVVRVWDLEGAFTLTETLKCVGVVAITYMS